MQEELVPMYLNLQIYPHVIVGLNVSNIFYVKHTSIRGAYFYFHSCNIVCFSPFLFPPLSFFLLFLIALAKHPSREESS